MFEGVTTSAGTANNLVAHGALPTNSEWTTTWLHSERGQLTASWPENEIVDDNDNLVELDADGDEMDDDEQAVSENDEYEQAVSEEVEDDVDEMDEDEVDWALRDRD